MCKTLNPSNTKVTYKPVGFIPMSCTWPHTYKSELSRQDDARTRRFSAPAAERLRPCEAELEETRVRSAATHSKISSPNAVKANSELSWSSAKSKVSVFGVWTGFGC